MFLYLLGWHNCIYFYKAVPITEKRHHFLFLSEPFLLCPDELGEASASMLTPYSIFSGLANQLQRKAHHADVLCWQHDHQTLRKQILPNFLLKMISARDCMSRLSASILKHPNLFIFSSSKENLLLFFGPCFRTTPLKGRRQFNSISAISVVMVTLKASLIVL